MLTTGNISLLPDNGEKLRESIAMQEKQIEEIAIELENTPLTQTAKSIEEEFTTQEYLDKFDSSYNSDYISSKLKSSPKVKELGKKAITFFES